MRIISGKYGSRQIKPVSGQNTRPTTDKTKESVFNLLGGYFEGGSVLDFYGGSGALAIEAVSRGKHHAVITEKYKPALKTIQANVKVTKEAERFTVLPGNNRKALLGFKEKNTLFKPFDLVFLDPPYKDQRIEADIHWLIEQDMLAPNVTIVVETDDKTHISLEETSIDLVKEKTYGQSIIRIFERSL